MLAAVACLAALATAKAVKAAGEASAGDACVSAQTAFMEGVAGCGIAATASEASFTQAQVACLCAMNAQLAAIDAACVGQAPVMAASQRMHALCTSTRNPTTSPTTTAVPTGALSTTTTTTFPRFRWPPPDSGSITPVTPSNPFVSEASPQSSVAAISNSLPSGSSNTLVATMPPTTVSTLAPSSVPSLNHDISDQCQTYVAQLSNVTGTCALSQIPTNSQVKCYCTLMNQIMTSMPDTCLNTPSIAAFNQKYQPVCSLAGSEAISAISGAFFSMVALLGTYLLLL